MKAEDLMIGDYIQFGSDDDPNFLTDIHQITCIDDFNNEIHADGEIYGLDYFRIKPIPLTLEILEKNGFVLKEEEMSVYGVNVAPYYTRNDVPFEVFCDGEPFAIWFKDPVNIEYVHELQHAMRLCKIKKEIVL